MLSEFKNLGINQDLFDYIIKTGNSSPYYSLLGMNIGAIGPGYAEVWTQIRHDHANPLGVAHGGLYMSLADAAMGTALRSLALTGVTVNLTTSFIAPGELGKIITASGKVLKNTKKIIYIEAKVAAEQKLLADVQGIFYKTGTINP